MFKKTSAKTPSTPAPLSVGTTMDTTELGAWYSPVLLGAESVGEYGRTAECVTVAAEVTSRLAEDAYNTFLMEFYREGLERCGERWLYADISTVLVAASRLAKPKSYMEIGVRRGRSMAMVSAGSPECGFVGFDMWIEDYAGLENPGAEFVRSELTKLGHTGSIGFVAGNSHETVPAYFEKNPSAFFDMITVDGDHSPSGARDDLETVIPRLAVGGVLVFDDICHPAHPELERVWLDTMKRHPELRSWEYTGIGYGVAVAVRTR